MTFGDGEFDVVVDKGTFDALMSDESEKVVKNFSGILKRIYLNFS